MLLSLHLSQVLNDKIFVVLDCSMLISGSSQLKKGMLSIAVYDKLAQAYRQFQVTVKLGTKNRSELHWHILAPGKFNIHIHFAGFVKFAFTTVMKMGFERTQQLNLNTVKNVLLMMYFRSASQHLNDFGSCYSVRQLGLIPGCRFQIIEKNFEIIFRRTCSWNHHEANIKNRCL